MTSGDTKSIHWSIWKLREASCHRFERSGARIRFFEKGNLAAKTATATSGASSFNCASCLFDQPDPSPQSTPHTQAPRPPHGDTACGLPACYESICQLCSHATPMHTASHTGRPSATGHMCSNGNSCSPLLLPQCHAANANRQCLWSKFSVYIRFVVHASKAGGASLPTSHQRGDAERVWKTSTGTALCATAQNVRHGTHRSAPGQKCRAVRQTDRRTAARQLRSRCRCSRCTTTGPQT